MGECRLNSWSKFWLVACHPCTDGPTASWAMQLTQRTRFRMLWSLPIPTCTSSEGRHRSQLGLPPSCSTSLDYNYVGVQDTSTCLSTNPAGDRNSFRCRNG